MIRVGWIREQWPNSYRRWRIFKKIQVFSEVTFAALCYTKSVFLIVADKFAEVQIPYKTCGTYDHGSRDHTTLYTPRLSKSSEPCNLLLCHWKITFKAITRRSSVFGWRIAERKALALSSSVNLSWGCRREQSWALGRLWADTWEIQMKRGKLLESRLIKSANILGYSSNSNQNLLRKITVADMGSKMKAISKGFVHWLDRMFLSQH